MERNIFLMKDLLEFLSINCVTLSVCMRLSASILHPGWIWRVTWVSTDMDLSPSHLKQGRRSFNCKRGGAGSIFQMEEHCVVSELLLKKKPIQFQKNRKGADTKHCSPWKQMGHSTWPPRLLIQLWESSCLSGGSSNLDPTRKQRKH